jgi:AcrR family transcriptional regulator
VATSGDQTREHLLDVAERLYGDLGVDNVSLRQIRLAAEQGNTAAVQYHFGDRDGVVRAIAERHQPRLLAVQAELVAAITARPGRARIRQQVEALVRPFADYVARGPSERAWIKILADLLADPRLSVATMTEHADDRAVELGRQLHAALCATMPADTASERLLAVSQFAVNLSATRARIVDDPEATRLLPSDDAFARNLVDMATGALTAPVSPST